MAFNSYSNNKDANKPYDRDLRSGYKFNNAESEVDKTCLTFGAWKQNLKITIAPKKENSDTEYATFDMDNGVTIFLNHTKARILSMEIKNFLRDPETYNSSGVQSGKGLITICNGSEFGVNTPCLVIRKIDENGNIVSSFAYQFKVDCYFSVRNYNGGTNYTKEINSYRNIEIEEMLIVLDEYCKAMTYMTAYSVIDATRYNNSYINSRINAIADKLGIEVSKGYSKSSRYSSNSFFANNGTVNNSESESYTAATLDDID